MAKSLFHWKNGIAHSKTGKITDGSIFATFIFVVPSILSPKPKIIMEPTAEISVIEEFSTPESEPAKSVIAP